MDRQHLMQRLDRVEQLARSSRWRRLVHRPVPYLSAIFFQRVIYPRFFKAWSRTARTFYGAPLRIDLPAATDIFLLGAKTHDSEIRLSRLLIRSLQKGHSFVDVGAHYGFYSLLAATLCGPEGKVLALEASPSTFELLQFNTQSFSQIEPLLLAAGDRQGTLTFYEFPTLYSEYNSLKITQFEGSTWIDEVQPTVIEVTGGRLDEILPRMSIHPDIIKIDVEGAEEQVVRGMEGLLDELQKTMIIIEYLTPQKGNTPHRQALNYLTGKGFGVFIIDMDGRPKKCGDIERHLKEKNLDSDNIVFLKTHRA